MANANAKAMKRKKAVKRKAAMPKAISKTTTTATTTKAAKRTRIRLICDELVGVTLWIGSVTCIVVATQSALLHDVMPALRGGDRLQMFLCGLVAALAVWQWLDLARGSCINPAVALAQYLAGFLQLADFAIIVLCQFVATVIGTAAVRAALADHVVHVLAPPQPHVDVHWTLAVAVEAACTAVICLLSLSLPRFVHPAAPVRHWFISTVVLVAVMATAADWTGSCMNPAVSFALAFLHQNWHMQSVYWVGPAIGAIAAAAFHTFAIEKRYLLTGPHNKQQ